MLLKVVWSPRAEESYVRIADFILKKWTQKEVKKFTAKTFSTITKISKNPKMFVESVLRKGIRKGYISKHTSLLYRVKTNEIELLYFWDNRQDPKKMVEGKLL